MLKLILNTGSEWAEIMSDILTAHEALAVSLLDNGDQALFQENPGEEPLWQDTRIEALFADDVQIVKIISELNSLLKSAFNYRVENVVEENWVEKTQSHFPVLNFSNRLWVAPVWQKNFSCSGALLRINPGLGFGTGTHPTTALCLEWLAGQDLTGKTVIDYGCGSGILGLAALALGASRVYAVDHDPQALAATLNNAELNQFSPDVLSIALPENLQQLKADIILANILANPLCELAPRFISLLASQGQIILSGFLEPELPIVLQAYNPALQVVKKVIQENWVSLVLRKN